MPCSNICQNYKFSKKGIKTSEYYANGAKRCQALCGGIWLKYDGIWCPCCNMQLRKTQRNKSKKILVRM